MNAKKKCIGMRRRKNGCGDEKCQRLAVYANPPLCRGCYRRVLSGGAIERTRKPWGRINAKKKAAE